MEVQLTPDQKAFVRERRRLEILCAVDRAEASLARGEGRSVTTLEEAKQLAEDVRRRGMESLRSPHSMKTALPFHYE
jgi:hypothetical protein